MVAGDITITIVGLQGEDRVAQKIGTQAVEATVEVKVDIEVMLQA